MSSTSTQLLQWAREAKIINQSSMAMANGGAVEEDQEEKWLKYYSSNHQILLVGEGDFSFSVCLAKSFGSASNIVASSLDSFDNLIKNYKDAKSNLEILKNLRASLLHGLDATKMKHHTDLRMRKFDRIVFNFPHAGFHGKEDEPNVIEMHRTLVSGFLRNARAMLRADGEIHINHKSTAPFCNWNLQELADRNFLTLIKCIDFRIEDYPGYNNKRGAGPSCDDPFPLGNCGTFKFIVAPAAAKKFKAGNKNLAQGNSQALQLSPSLPQQRPIPFNFPQVNFIGHVENTVKYARLPLYSNPKNECDRIFGEYLHHASETFGRIDYDVNYSVHEALRLGYERYMAEDPGRPSSGYIDILQELHHRSMLRITWLGKMLAPASHLHL